jgi:hypothetical protein
MQGYRLFKFGIFRVDLIKKWVLFVFAMDVRILHVIIFCTEN